MGEAGPPSGTGMPPVVPAALRSTSYLTYRGARAAGRGRINLRRRWLSLQGRAPLPKRLKEARPLALMKGCVHGAAPQGTRDVACNNGFSVDAS